MGRDLLPEELIQSLLQQAVILTLQSHGYTSIHPFALNLLIETVEKRLLSLLRRAASMANTQRRTIPSPTDLNYAFLMENIHTYSLEDEMSRWSSPPHLHPSEEPLNAALLPSPVDERVYTRAILPTALRPTSNTPSSIPSTFPQFPPKYTYSFTPSYPPRAVDPETIRRKAVAERALVEQSLARLVNNETHVQSTGGGDVGGGNEGREAREEVWWETWREMGCDLDRGGNEIWPVGKMRRGLAG